MKRFVLVCLAAIAYAAIPQQAEAQQGNNQPGCVQSYYYQSSNQLQDRQDCTDDQDAMQACLNMLSYYAGPGTNNCYTQYVGGGVWRAHMLRLV